VAPRWWAAASNSDACSADSKSVTSTTSSMTVDDGAQSISGMEPSFDLPGAMEHHISTDARLRLWFGVFLRLTLRKPDAGP
jgi:hypothetical protein